MGTKICTKCLQEMEANADNFHRDKRSPDGFLWQCKKCQKKYREENKDKISKRRKEYEQENIDAIRERGRRRYHENKERRQKKSRDYYWENRDVLLQKQKERWANNPEKWREYRKKYYKENREKMLKQSRLRRTNPKHKMSVAMRCNMSNSLRRGSKAGRPWESLAGYSLDDLRKHLESQFQEGMTWDNYGEWHIDHIIPISAFNYTKPEHIDFKRCWALENLRPLWGTENMSKNARIDEPMQPSLMVEF